MNLDAFLKSLDRLWAGDPQTADHPIDRKFKPIVDATKGMATENKLALLNLACRHLNDGECYVEVGTFRGTSVIGAALSNPSRRFYAVDNFSQFGGTEAACRKNLDAFGVTNVTLVNGTAWRVLRAHPFAGPVGVYFYDGRHRFQDQYRAFGAIESQLSDEALVIVDDTGWTQVAKANELYTRTRPQYQLLRRWKSPINRDPRWWNGIEVYAFRRKLGPGSATSPLAYAGSFARFNGAVALAWCRHAWSRKRTAKPLAAACGD